MAAFVIAIDAFSGQSANKSELSYTGFIQQVQQKKVESVTITNDHGIKGKLKNGTEFNSYAPSDETLIKTLQDNGVEITAAPPEQPAWWMSLLGSAIPIIILVVLFFFIMQQTQGGGGRVMNFGKSRAKLMGEGNVKVSFKDVAGAEEAKQELEEVVEFLKDPGKFTTIGAKIPKGVLLAGPPGTGKTLLAKAVAGEAGVPFFTISGSDFVEMFVGVGASRVRDLFTQAKKNAPCIIFIDEIDAVGRQRGAGLGGGHDEREQTLNQLLVEMDGFGANEGIITIAATNRPDILDPALLRPGRFDRQVIVGRPDLRGREAILKVHARNKPLADDVDLKTIAKKTPGFTGADLNNLLNEAALLAARLNKKVITMAEVEEASEKVSMGPERRSHIVSEKDRKLTAYHESGHAIVAHLLPHADPVHKVTIIPRGAAGGYTMMLPTEEQNYKTKSQLLADIRVALGGRIAEALILDEISTGASGDLQSVTNTARAMVTRWGMSDELGPIVFGEQQEQVFLGKNLGHERNYSEEIAAKIDSEIHRIVEEAYKDVTKLLSENEKFLHDMANALLEEETIDSKAVDNLYKYGTTKAPEVEEPKEALEAAGIVVPEVVEAKENTATVDAPSETPSNEIK
ncbi:ATP-dependent zinc metalloprotease FtsH [Veillonella rogosae]|uniref:ATP-dependent zinc metalloprotease FtsH n=1 Tax=Veillonella rogosae TaxID=423477 RepID=A0AA46X9V4_9FIRM|nr:ATP-dependent zinc metalloprotease FtsH [Veillonella rogosae]